MPLYKTEGIILKKQEFGETDEIISLLSPDFGNKKILVKGVRKAKGSRVGKFELFSSVRLLLATGKSFDICSQVELVSSRRRLRADLLKMTYGLYLLELFDSLLLFSEPQSSYFFLLESSLKLLEKEKRLELICIFVTFHLLRQLGYEPAVHHCTQCRKIVQKGYFSALAGGVLCGECSKPDKQSVRIARDVCDTLAALAGISDSGLSLCNINENAALKARKVLEYYIYHRFSKRIRASRLIDQVQYLEKKNPEKLSARSFQLSERGKNTPGEAMQEQAAHHRAAGRCNDEANNGN